MRRTAIVCLRRLTEVRPRSSGILLTPPRGSNLLKASTRSKVTGIHLCNMPSPADIALVTALVTSSYFTFSSIGISFFGVMPATARGRTALAAADRLALWEFSYEGGKLHMGVSGIISALALSVGAYLTSAPLLRNVLAAGAVAAYTVPLFTTIFLLPTNKDLIAMRKANAVKPMGSREEQRALDQLDKWRALHRVRITLGLFPWLASAVALLAADPIIRL
ncbi:hypothetical protein MVEN_02084400 [Mycena venus]|uniref:DUF1772-domain-containing protein n=1 Tax=Mycena venus TaxID=2733690 RepID=A0A8H6XDK5_9AGAR|nr:hypothetical protein MVEN_02084400 [Mycena venus]